jgi:hypothetical protein
VSMRRAWLDPCRVDLLAAIGCDVNYGAEPTDLLMLEARARLELAEHLRATRLQAAHSPPV